MSRQKSHLLGDKQISSVGIFDVVAFYTLFRVHLTLIIVYICPKKVLYCSFSGFLCFDGNYAEIGTFGRVLGQTGSNTASQVTTRRRPNFDQRAQFQACYMTASPLTTRRHLIFNQRAQHQAGHMTPSQDTTRRRHGPLRNPRFWKLLLSDGVVAYKATPSRPVIL